jgi:hypothetical protein
MVARRRPDPKKRGGNGHGRDRDKTESEGPDSDPFKKGLLAGLQTISKTLTAISRVFAAGSAESAVGEQAVADAVQECYRAFAEALGKMLVLFPHLERHADSLARKRQYSNLDKLWTFTLELVSRLNTFHLTTAQRDELSRAFEALSLSASEGSEDDGLRAVQIVIKAFETSPEVREALLQQFTKRSQQSKEPRNIAPSAILRRAHALTGFTIIIYTRTGLLHNYIQGGKN